ncbi:MULTISPECIES: hypothetical protein [Cyanophyceae]|uniref:hypothetical protein n=1 Tax=Cyanophyceae TaxID=3028117 RepID=UPI0016838B0F|nr:MULTISPECIES: hypothetical protein [Cyanophyceae]MBD1915752.1 hypothetical protein [Phormidium sp. FACHB-77]MBD2030061.1 hypothetical protein [Phormidium sp. FACHB-322]MBD2052173.1 hypothetical protein [Leptolyngbya sp. FACHB-60]
MSSKDNPTNLPQVNAAPPVAGFTTATATAWDNNSENGGLLTEVILRSANAPHAIAAISEAVRKEVARIEQSIVHARHRLEHFEVLYNVSSSEFAERFTAEDLQGGDLEYVEWIGEYQLFQHLLQDLTLLKSLTYVAE